MTLFDRLKVLYWPVHRIGSKEFRDPSVFWYEPQQKGVMATEHHMALSESKT